MNKKRCLNCGCKFSPKKHITHQEYCAKKSCQSERMKAWRKYKLKHDKNYKAYRKAIQDKWRTNNPDYWMHYKKSFAKKIKTGEKNTRKVEAKKPSIKILLGKDILLNLRKIGVINCNCELVLRS